MRQPISTRSVRFAVAAMLSAAASGVTAPSSKAQDARLAIEPMTRVGANPVGYFQDPYKVRLAPTHRSGVQVFSGTTKALMACAAPISAGCFSWTPLHLFTGTLGSEITAAHSHFTNFQNLNVFQTDAGEWHAVLAIGVARSPTTGHWTVLVHARPTTATPPDVLPLSWTADKILSGSFAEQVEGNYDGKYYEEDGHLYLLYVANLIAKPGLRNGIVIRPMISPTQRGTADPAILLTPGDRFGPLNSEWYDHTQAKLVEAPYIIRIGGKHALIYSTGAYQYPDYKAGVAWSDTLVPPAGGRYRKVLRPDTQGVWGRPGVPEIHYLLQSQKPGWPNYTGGQVVSPGVASAGQGPDGNWDLYFAGYDPADRPRNPPGVAIATYRRGYFVGLRLSVPANLSVAQASDAQLATWMQPETVRDRSAP